MKVNSKVFSTDIYNCHLHTFREADVPEKFLPRRVMDYLRSKDAEYLAQHLIEELHKIKKRFRVNLDEVEKYLQFVTIGNKKTQKEIFENCAKNFTAGSRFFVLSMDMKYMGAGNVPRPFEEQLRELAELDRERIRPFVHIDVRRPEYFTLLRNCVEKLGFRGVKLYPPLGVFPFDRRYDPVYQYCIEHNLPVISHCSPRNPVHFRGSRSELVKLLKNDYFEVKTEFKTRKELCDTFTHPSNYEYVCDRFGDLRICLAHFGSSKEWKKYIDKGSRPTNWLTIVLNLMRKYPNLYTDISYTMYHKEYLPLFKTILDEEKICRKVLYGTDYYMPASAQSDAENAEMVKLGIGDEKFRIIAVENPARFLDGLE